MIDRYEKFYFCISVLSRYLHRISTEVMEQFSLSGPQAVYFTVMYRHPQGITSAKLAEICSKDKSDVSRSIQLFEKRGLVKKKDESASPYRALLCLTEDGKRIAKHISEKAVAAVENGGRGLTESEREIFYKALDLIASNLQAISEKGI